MSKSNYFKANIKTIIIFVFIISSVILSSCSAYSEQPIETSTPTPLFDHNDLNKMSVLSGNLHFKSFLTSDSGFIYFHSKDNSGLIKADFDGKNKNIISEKMPGYITTAGDMVYFTEGSLGGKIYKVNNQGEGESITTDANSGYVISQYDFIYYIDINSGNAFKTNHDGSNTTKITNYLTDEIIIFDDKIYFLINDISISENSLILEADLDYIRDLKRPLIYPFEISSEKLRVHEFNGRIKNICAEENYIFYSQNGKIIKYSKVRNKNSDTRIETSFPFITSGEYIYYINQKDNFRIYRAKIDKSSSNELIVNDMVEEFVVCGNSIYYRRSRNNDIYRTPVSGGISSKIT